MISVVVTLYNESASLDEPYRRTAASLEHGERDRLRGRRVDRRQPPSWSACTRRTGGWAVRFRRNFGQHPAMHAGLVRAQGDVVVTMDGDLQNAPEDVLEARRRDRRRRRRGQRARGSRGVTVGADAAVQADQRHAAPLHRRRRLRLRLRVQRVPAGGVGADARGSASRSSRKRSCSAAATSSRSTFSTRRGRVNRYSPLRLTRLALHVLAASGRSRSSGSASRRESSARSRPSPSASTASRTGSAKTTSRAAVRRSCDRVRPRHPGLHPRPRRRIPGQNPARRGRTASLHDRARALSKRVLVTGGAGFISSNVVRHLLTATPHEVVSLDALTYAGNLENLADVMSHERLAFVQATSATRSSSATSWRAST